VHADGFSVSVTMMVSMKPLRSLGRSCVHPRGQSNRFRIVRARLMGTAFPPPALIDLLVLASACITIRSFWSACPWGEVVLRFCLLGVPSTTPKVEAEHEDTHHPNQRTNGSAYPHPNSDTWGLQAAFPIPLRLLFRSSALFCGRFFPFLLFFFLLFRLIV